jgi:hypothetical protein
MTTMTEVGQRLAAEAATASADPECHNWLSMLDATDPETAPIRDVLKLAGSAPTPFWAGFMVGQCAIRLRRVRG